MPPESNPPSADSSPADPSPADPSPADDDDTRILRRAPLAASAPPSETGDPPTSLIRRHPTGDFPAAASDPATTIVPTPGPTPGPEVGSAPFAAPRARPVTVGPPHSPLADPRSAIATTVASILSGWATGVIATDLITGWWGTDLLFCIAVGFLTAVSAAATIGGVVALLLRRRTARLLIVVGSVVALLIFASLFVAGAKLAGAVYALPVLPLASIVLAVLPATARWSRSAP